MVSGSEASGTLWSYGRDGYGDDYRDLLLAKERLLQIQVAERLSDPALWDDVLQEARIAAWEIARKHPEKSAAYMHAATRRRIGEVITRGVWTGMQGRQGLEIDPLRRRDRESLDDPLTAFEASAPDQVDALLLAYHQGEIFQAIDELPAKHKRYVMLRFWCGWTAGELAPIVGVKATNQARMWNEAIRPVLAKRLAHLACT